MSTSSGTWKAFERTVASFFGSVRTALSGGNSKVTRSDTHHPDLYIECKYRARCSLHTLYEDTKKKAEAEGKIPILCTKQKNSTGFLVTVHSSDYNALFRKGNHEETNINQPVPINPTEHTTDSREVERLRELCTLR